MSQPPKGRLSRDTREDLAKFDASARVAVHLRVARSS
jgi:hypothetical protein